MKKLVIISENQSKYSKIINDIRKLNLEKIQFINQKNFHLKLILRYDVIIFENLNINYLKKIHEQKIITICINKKLIKNKFVDI